MPEFQKARLALALAAFLSGEIFFCDTVQACWTTRRVPILLDHTTEDTDREPLVLKVRILSAKSDDRNTSKFSIEVLDVMKGNIPPGIYTTPRISSTCTQLIYELNEIGILSGRMTPGGNLHIKVPSMRDSPIHVPPYAFLDIAEGRGVIPEYVFGKSGERTSPAEKTLQDERDGLLQRLERE